MSDLYSDCGLSPVWKSAPSPTARLSDIGVENIPPRVRNSGHRLEPAMTDTPVRKGSLSDNGLFPTWGRPEHVADDVMKCMGLVLLR